MLRELVDQLEPIGDVVPAVLQAAKQIVSQLSTVLMRQELMLTANEKLLAAHDETLAAKDQTLAANGKTLELALAANEKVLAANEKAHAATEWVSSKLVDEKTAELASFKAQFEPRIMIDILYDAFADDLKKGKKWETLLDGVITTDAKNNSILTPAAMRDLADLNATMELATVVRDLDAKSISSCLASAHHKGASDVTGTGWRLGVQVSPSLAVALILIANLRKLDERNIYSPLNGRVAFLNVRADVSHELDVDSLRWVQSASSSRSLS